MVAYWLGRDPPRKTRVSVPRLTPVNRVLTSTSPGRARAADGPDLARPGLAQPERAGLARHRSPSLPGTER